MSQYSKQQTAIALLSQTIDHRWEVVITRSKCSLSNVAPENAEAIGVREALSWIKEQQIGNVLVETNCLVVQAIRSFDIPLSYFGKLIEECKTLLSELKGRNVIIKFVKHSVNKVAHFLAKSTYSVTDRIWRVCECDNHPKFIDVLMNDLSHEWNHSLFGKKNIYMFSTLYSSLTKVVNNVIKGSKVEDVE